MTGLTFMVGMVYASAIASAVLVIKTVKDIRQSH